jgi:membrane protein
MAGKISKYWDIIKNTFKEFADDEPFDYAAIIGFYTIFSLPAILIIMVQIASAAFGEDAVRGELSEQISGIAGESSAQQIQNIIENAWQSESGTLALIIGIATLLFSATTVFVALQNSINAVWGVKAKPEKGWLKFIINRVLSLAMVVSLGFILLVSLFVDVVLGIVSDYLSQLFQDNLVYLMQVVNIAVSLGIVTLIFAVIYKYLPDAKIEWRNVWTGAFVTTLLFTLGKYLINLYLQQDPLTDTYGAAGSLVLILVWVYYASIIFLLGAEFTQVYSRAMGQGIRPSDHAVRVKIREEEHDSSEEEEERQKRGLIGRRLS